MNFFFGQFEPHQGHKKEMSNECKYGIILNIILSFICLGHSAQRDVTIFLWDDASIRKILEQ